MDNLVVPIRSRLNAIRRNGFVRSASVLVGGTAAAQALTVLALPVLTRLYSPEDFSVLAVYVAILTMVQVLACLRLEIAIPLPEDDVEAANLLALALVSAASAAALAGALVLGFGGMFFSAIGQPEMQPFGWLLPFGIWLAGSYAAMQFWSTRKKRFPTIARTRMMQVGSGLTAQLGLGWAGAGPVGLMLGHALMAGAGAVNLARQAWRCDRPALTGVTRRGMRRALSAHRRFPLYSTWDALATNASTQVPVLLIATFAIGPEAGFLMLAMRVVGAPLQMIGNAVAQVYLSGAAEEWRRGTLYRKTRTIARNMFLFVSLPILVATALAAPFFDLLFGEEWARAGAVALWLSPMFAVRAIASPISMVMNVIGKQRQMMALKFLGLFVRVGATFIAALIGNFTIEAYALSSAAIYLLFFLVFLKSARSARTHFNPH